MDATGQWFGRGLISTGLALDLDLEFLTKIFVFEEEDPLVLLLFPFAIFFCSTVVGELMILVARGNRYWIGDVVLLYLLYVVLLWLMAVDGWVDG